MIDAVVKRRSPNGSLICNLALNDAGKLLSESFIDGVLAGLSVTNRYDQYLRRTNVAVVNSQSSILAATAYGYDAASRLQTVADGTNSVAYQYLANSPLIAQIAYTNNGA